MSGSNDTQPPIEPPTRSRYLVLFALSLAAVIAYAQRNSIGICEQVMREDLGLSLDEMGSVMSAFFFSYALFQLPSGWLSQLWGSRLALSVFSIGWSISSAALALATLGADSTSEVMIWGFPTAGWILLGVRFLMGGWQAGIFPASTLSVSEWMPSTGRALATGALGSSMSIGGALGATGAGYLVIWYGWQWVFILYALPGIVWAIWFFVWFRDRPAEHSGVNAAELELITGNKSRPVQTAEVASAATVANGHDQPNARPKAPWGEILTSPVMWALNVQQFLRAAGYIFFATWFATYLREAHGVSTEQSGLLTSLPLYGVVIGSLLGGAASDAIYRATGSLRWARQGLGVLSMLACGLLVLLAYSISNVQLSVAVIALGSMFAGFAGPCAYALTIDLGGRHVAPVFSMMNMWGNIGAMVFPKVVPLLIVAEQPESWDRVLFLFAGIYFVAAVSWLCLNPSRSVVSDAA